MVYGTRFRNTASGYPATAGRARPPDAPHAAVTALATAVWRAAILAATFVYISLQIFYSLPGSANQMKMILFWGQDKSERNAPVNKAESSGGNTSQVQMKPVENQIVVYQPNETVRLDVRLENETVWLNRHQMAQLFGRDVKTIGKHIANALSEELACSSVVADFATTQRQQNPTSAKFAQVEVTQNPTVANFATVQQEGGREVVRKVEYYSLDVVLSVGYRVKSVQGILFRRWANTVLKEYLLRGYSVNVRLNQLEDKMDRRFAKTEADVAELKEKVEFFVQTQTPPLQGVFYNGQLWDARALVLSLIARAKRSGKCCQCENVASCQFQFSIEEVA